MTETLAPVLNDPRLLLAAVLGVLLLGTHCRPPHSLGRAMILQ